MSLTRTLTASAVLAAAVTVGACSNGAPTSPRYRGNCPTTAGTLTIPDTVTGTLATTSCKLGNNSYAEVWVLDIVGIQTLQLDLTSASFDTFLFVKDSRGARVVENDDQPPGTDSRIVQSFSQGTYYVYANSYDPLAIGGYTLSVVPYTTP